MFMPYVSFVDGFPIPLAVLVVGLIFFVVVNPLSQRGQVGEVGQFLALTFAGMLTTHAFIVGIGNLRTLLTRPEKPMYFGLKMTSFLWLTLVVFLAGSILWNASGANISVRSARRWPSSTKSRLWVSSRTMITATTAGVVTSNVRWASKMCQTTWPTPNVSVYRMPGYLLARRIAGTKSDQAMNISK